MDFFNLVERLRHSSSFFIYVDNFPHVKNKSAVVVVKGLMDSPSILTIRV